MKEFTIELSIDPEPITNPAFMALPDCQTEWEQSAHDKLISQLEDCGNNKIIEYVDIKIPNDHATLHLWQGELLPRIKGKNIHHLEIQNMELIRGRTSKKYQNIFFIKCLNEIIKNVNYVHDYNIHIRVEPEYCYSLVEFEQTITENLKVKDKRFVGWIYNNTYSVPNKAIKTRGKEIPVEEEYIGEISFNSDIDRLHEYKTYKVRE